VIKQFERKMGPCPSKFKAFAWEQSKNKPYTVNQFFDGLYETLRLLNERVKP
jgi:hypothetical protein